MGGWKILFESFVGKPVKVLFDDAGSLLVYTGKITKIYSSHLEFLDKFGYTKLFSVDRIKRIEILSVDGCHWRD